MGKDRLAILAGGGRIPALAYAEAEGKGREPFLLALAEAGAPAELEAAGLPHEVVSVGKPQDVLDLLADRGAGEILIVGKIPKELHFEKIEFDARALSILARMQSRSDASLFAALAEEFEAEGILVAGQSRYLAPYLAEEGVCCGGGVPAGREKEALLALETARAIARLDIGQTVVTKDGVVVAVEAFEHTDDAIRRGGELAGAGTWVAKAARPNQDDRFDVPAAGEGTVRVMAEAGATLLVLEAGRVFLFDREEAARLAGEHGISIVAM